MFTALQPMFVVSSDGEIIGASAQLNQHPFPAPNEISIERPIVGVGATGRHYLGYYDAIQCVYTAEATSALLLYLQRWSSALPYLFARLYIADRHVWASFSCVGTSPSIERGAGDVIARMAFTLRRITVFNEEAP